MAESPHLRMRIERELLLELQDHADRSGHSLRDVVEPVLAVYVRGLQEARFDRRSTTPRRPRAARSEGRRRRGGKRRR